MSIPIPMPEHFQLQSPLIQLPAEIKHIIYGYCFAADGPITDPPIGDVRTIVKTPLNLGVALLQTCRRVYHEADRRLLYSQNTFRFTTVDRVRCFFRSLDDTYGAFVQDIEVDASKVHSDHPSIAREWLQYLACGNGPWGKMLGSLRVDAPNLKCLRLNFETWPTYTMFRAGLWELLRVMLSKVEGLQRIVVIGAASGMQVKTRDPWSPVHFVGGDDVRDNDLVQCMSKVVGEPNISKVVRWTRDAGRLYLEVVSKTYLVKYVDRSWSGPTIRQLDTDPWPESGSCTLVGFESRDVDFASSSTRTISHNVFV